MAANYFTCTLGQATALGKTNPEFKNINQFIDSQAHATPDQPAVGFAKPTSNDKPWGKTVFTFKDVHGGSLNTAALFKRNYGHVLARSNSVALICPSTPDFLLTWLALMRLGHAVLLIAPQCQPAAIAHLCKACETSMLFYDDVFASQAQEAAKLAKDDGVELAAELIPFAAGEQDLSEILAEEPAEEVPSSEVGPLDVAYLHHTSGTSSGVPKPIPQSHRAGAGVLPSFAEGRECATFTTTPLYHGGIADLFRAWTSGALIWLFPGKDVPITAGNIVKCLDVAADCSRKDGLPHVKYFSSVPYVLQMMEADEKGLRYLRSMDIVGVGGAALPAEVGDRMVSKGVNLISRFGSAECGFLMSSHRDYAKDKEWQYLRSGEGAEYMKFEKQEDGQAELVILEGWPHMAKRNRDDGSFATADLFAPHPSIPDAWRYHSRADSQLTLITGKKFDPAPLEGAIAASDLLDDVLIFGNGQPFPGVLLFRAEATRQTPDAELVDKLWPVVEKLNSESQDHARIPRRMLVPMPVLDQPLEKSSKGTILRGAVESRFAESISSAYTNTGAAPSGDVPDDQVLQALKDMVKSIVPKKAALKEDTDLFSYGVDSVAGMQIRYGLRQLLPQSSKELPLNVVEDCGTVARLAEYVVKQRHGQALDSDEDELQMMQQLVEEYSNFHQQPAAKQTDGENAAGSDADASKDVVVLTGATGALGAHILDLYRKSESTRKVYCLVRGADVHASKERVGKALEQRSLKPLSDDGKVIILQAQLGDPQLGLSDEDYGCLSKEATIIMHVAWSVNFRQRLRSFVKDNIASVTNLINLALSSHRSAPPKFAYCSSVASVLNYAGDTIPEEIVEDPAAATTLGYSRSKWVAEGVCQRASDSTPLRGRIAVFRVGQLSGDSETGVWNTKEAWPMMLSAVKITHSLPKLEKESLDWLPVDVAAIALMQGIASGGRGRGDGNNKGDLNVLHVLNPHREPTWMEMLGWADKKEQFDIVSPPEWVAQLEEAGKQHNDHPALKLLDHWKKAFTADDDAGHRNRDSSEETHLQGKSFAMVKTKQVVPVLQDVRPIDKQYFAKIWTWIEETM